MGVGIYNTGTLTVNYGGAFTGNTAEDGGAIYNATGGTATLSGPSFSGNSASSVTAGFGGALDNAGVMTVAGSALSSNTAQNDGPITTTAP